jgi:peptidyl-dipeptidase Dcp
MSTNPFARRSELEFEMPPFEEIREEHYLPAFYEGAAEQLQEIEAILATDGETTFENTIVALERSGQYLIRMLTVFYNISSSDTNDNLDAIEAEFAPKLAAHSDAIKMNQGLFARITYLYEAKAELNLNEEDSWLLDRYYLDFRHAGAHLDEPQRNRIKEINERLSFLETQFAKNILNDTNDLAVLVDDAAKLEGLSQTEIDSAAAAANDRGHAGKWLIPLVNYSGHPALAELTDRELRQLILERTLLRSNRDNEHDNKATLVEMAKLRAERARFFGVANHAEYVLANQTAKHPDNVHAMLRKIAPAAIRNARLEGAALQEQINQEGGNFELRSWDWDFYTEKVRKAKYEIDSAALRPYFELERVLHDGVFFAANKVFGLTFKERPDIKTYHPEARAFEVGHEDGSVVGLFIGDFFTRDSKRGGAWMNNLVEQNFLLNQLPVVVNNLNAPKPAPGEPALLTFDMTTTLFHEFGHALHGLLSKVKYPRVAGTNVERDFVEFPSQVNEMWMLWPEVLDNYAKHYQTGERLPKEIIDRIEASKSFNEGHATSSYVAAAILDLAWHQITPDTDLSDVVAFEAAAIKDYGLDYEPVPVRYRSTYFSHIFAGGYSAGYYGYIWSEVLDADAVEWFKENGGMVRANGDHFSKELLSRGGSIDTMQMFRNFRGRDASIEPLLRRRGLN